MSPAYERHWVHNRPGPPHLLYGDHSSVKFGSVQVADTLCGLVGCRHSDESIAPSPRTAGIGHHFSSNDLHERGSLYFLTKITTQLVKNYKQLTGYQKHLH